MDPAPLHIMTGKGGTGKTTVSLVLAASLAMDGGRILVCEVEGRGGLAAATGRRTLAAEQPLFSAGAGAVHGLEVEPEAALTEYLERNAGLGIAGRALDKSGLGAFATSIAPGLRDILLIGKVYEAARRTAKGRPDAYDAIILDAPPTGRIGTFLGAGDALADVARGGPVARQARSIMDVLRHRTTQVHLVTLLRELAVTETIGALAGLRDNGFRVGTVYCNQVEPTAPAVPDDLDLPLPDTVRAGLHDILVSAANRSARQLQWRDHLAGYADAIADVPVATGELGTAGIVELAKALPSRTGSSRRPEEARS
jgi:hypothetical protein